MLTARTAARRLWSGRHALAGVEFALVLPVLLTLLAGLVDLSLAVITVRRLTVASQDVALIASTMAVQANNPNVLSGQQAWQATTAPFALFPAWRNSDGPATFSITLSAVDFTGTPAGCSGTHCTGYTATTRWSVSNPKGQVQLRPCGRLAAVLDGSAADHNSLPAGAFGPTSLLVGDVSTVFTPLFTSLFVGPIPLFRSSFVPPRVNNGVALSGSGPGTTASCPRSEGDD